MYATSDKQRGGLLVAVITGGRPKLSERPTRKFFQQLHDAGVHDIVWVVSEKDAPHYERDDNELAVYPMEWAEKYASEHWMNPKPYESGSFFGAFVGREWACLEAERRGCWGVMQLDDNIISTTAVAQDSAGEATLRVHGGMGFIVDVLAGVALSTNGKMVGAQLTSVITNQAKVSRPGFPYSCFIERVGDGREHWYGPFEDDITHAFQYGTRADSSTALVVPMLRYRKESKSTSGMRSKYNHERAVQLQRIFPESAKVVAKSTKSNGVRGDGMARVFHQMQAGAIRNPQVILDRELYGKVRDRVTMIVRERGELAVQVNRKKMRKRAAEG
ncbi:GREB1-related protein [Corynebacterium macginleyi]|uniref:GREB1-related protein n=1 Tax=Corynebacterium macginleyi TaxID=38290 RepID=UPI00190965E7|nr:hypothetical protein [Corynebacterium macginleyi]MBK4183159.1 hypothetical protein [Corynebacterium macginleyi]